MKLLALKTTSEPYGLLTSILSQLDAAKFVSMRLSTSTSPSDSTVLIPVLRSIMFWVSTVSSAMALVLSVPLPKNGPKMTDGSMATISTGRSRIATAGMSHFFEFLAVARAAPCTPPVAAPFVTFATALPVFTAACTVDSALFDCWFLCSSDIRCDPFFSAPEASDPQCVHCI